MKTTARKLSMLSAHLLNIDPDMTMSRLYILSVVAQSEDNLVRDIVKRTGLSQPTVARTLSFLGDKPSRGKRDGLGLVKVLPDPLDPRRMFVNITPRGERMLEEATVLLER